MHRPLIVLVVAIAGLVWRADCSAAPTPRMLVEIADLSDVAISPDGRSVAFREERASVERNTYDSVWYVQDSDGARAPRRIADGGAPLRYAWGVSIIEPPQWSPDSQWIYYRAEFDGQVQVWRAASDGSRAEPVTRDAGDVASFTLSRDGHSLLYEVGATREAIQNAEQQEFDHGIRIDGSVMIGQSVYRSGYINGRLATKRLSGDGWDEGGLLADQPKRRIIVDLASLETRPMTQADQVAFARDLPIETVRAVAGAASSVRSPTSGQVAFLEPVERKDDHHILKTLRVAQTADASVSISCPAPACQEADIAALAWRPGGNEVVFTVTDHERGRAQSLYAWNLDNHVVRLITRAEGLLNGGRVESGDVSCSIGVDAALCVAAAASTPPRLERLDLETGARRVLYEPNKALADSSERPAEFMTWLGSRGERFTGQFYPPATPQPAAPAPLFVTYYTCPGYVRGGSPGDEWPLAAMAQVGIAAICINTPFSSPYDAPTRYDRAISAVQGVVDLLSQRGMVDRARVGMGGLSFGSEATLWLAMHTDLLSAASVASPDVSAIYYWFTAIHRDDYPAVIRKFWGLGAPGQTMARWRELSPSLNIDQIHAPLLMQIPEQEYLITMDYFTPLSQSPTPTEMYVFPYEPHQKFLPQHKLAAYERNLDWFRFWLQGYTDPDPQKADQYRRWSALKARAKKAGLRAGRDLPTPSLSGRAPG